MTPKVAIRRWAAALAGLDPSVIVEVQALATRIDALLGPLRPRGVTPEGDPDGYRDLTRRGPFDRLVLSEWALLDEVPDEFVRRAATRELSFYELDRRQPGKGLRVRVVFDAGPEQLGAPRLGQLAALFALHRRALEQGAELVWSGAQAPKAVLSTVAEAPVTAWAAARSVEPFVMPDLTTEPAWDELWIVGPGAAAGVPADARFLALTEVDDDDAERLVARVVRRGRADVSAELPLPPPGVRTRLLTEPFLRVAAPPPPPRRAPDRGPARGDLPSHFGRPIALGLCPGTHQFVVHFSRGHAAWWSLSKMKAGDVPKPRVEYVPVHALCGLGFAMQCPVHLAYSGEGGDRPGVLSVVSPRGWKSRVADDRPAVGAGKLVWLHRHDAVLLLDVTGALFLIRRDQEVRRVADAVLDVGQSGNEPCVLVRRGATIFEAGFLPPSLETGQAVEAATDAFYLFGYGGEHAGLAAHTPAGWTLWTPAATRRQPWPTEPTPGARPLGRSVWWRPGTTELTSHGTAWRLPRVPSSAYAVNERLLVLHTESTVEVWDLQKREPVMLRVCP